MKKNIVLILIVAAFTFGATLTESSSSEKFQGFTASSAAFETKYEDRFDNLLSASHIDTLLKTLSARPHHVGSPYDAQNAQYLLQQYRSWGYDAHIDTFYALFPTPKVRILEGVAPFAFKPTLAEPPLKEDGTSSQTTEQLPGYNCYSADGDVTAELVYVNYGLPDDYEQLERMGIDVKGKIVISRYGGGWRGIKPRLAQEHGAVGCIIYSDPKEDGYYQGDVYPKGPYRNENGIQRGSVLDMPMYPGDPQTPGYGATKDAKRINRKDVKNLLKIPVMPISYKDAKGFLEHLGGPVAPESWRGALPFTYHIGPGPVKAHLKLEFNWDVKQVHDVIAMLKGSVLPDEWVIRGNHYDAWVNGADDPLSGQSAMLEEAKAIGELAKEGMRPKRTVVFCSWDGEEEGLLGSTEWAETNSKELQQKGVAYINTDASGRGFLGAGGTHTLQKLVNDVAADVTDPQTGISIAERRKANDVVHASNDKDKKELLASHTMKIDALGSGSDFSSFMQHLGIPCLDLGFGGESGGGEYHSVYDSYDMFKRFKDPGMVYEVVLAKTAGRLTLRLANADALPFHFGDFYSNVNDYTTELTKLMDEMRTSTEVNNELIKNRYYQQASDPTKKYVPPVSKDAVPYLDFAPIQNALASLKTSTEQYEAAIPSATQLDAASLNKINTLLYQTEQKLLLENGLPNRPWYKHSVYAPGYFTGYGVKTLPGIREAIENRDWKLAQQQIEEASKTLTAYSKQIDVVVDMLKKK